MNQFQTGLIRVNHIRGNPKANPPIPAIIPATKPTFWLGIKEGRYAQLVKLDKSYTAWRAEGIHRHIESVGGTV